MISAEVDATAALQMFQDLLHGAQDRTIPNRQLSVQLQGWVLRNFQSEGALQDPPWEPLAESTRLQKEEQGYSSAPLVRTGHLRQSFRGFYDNDRAGVGSEVPYGEFHERGTDLFPQRAMLPSERVALDYARQIYERWAARLAQRTA